MGFAGARVLSLESRRAVEIETLIRKADGVAMVAPSVREQALGAGESDAGALLEKIEGGGCDLLILMTGVGLTLWRQAVETQHGAGRAEQALRRVKLLARGPKPAAVLRSAGIEPDILVPEPNTWREVVAALVERPERALAVQEYGRENLQMVNALEQLGASVETFAIYRWELPEDTGPLRAAAVALSERAVDVVLFTSSVQLEHLFLVASEQGLEEEVTRALAEDVVIASIGPVMNQALRERGLEPEIVPQSPKMGALVHAAAAQATAALERKRRQVTK